MITLIVAYNCNRIIADEKGNIPWNIKEDLQFFRKSTLNTVCIMGRKTWDSLPQNVKPLSKRVNIIVTRETTKFCRENPTLLNADLVNNSYVVGSFEVAVQIARILKKEISVIGGGEVYKYFLENNLADRIWASEIKGYEQVSSGVYFPEVIDWNSTTVQKFPEFIVKEYFKKSN
jgi:dihydrofolate reductase